MSIVTGIFGLSAAAVLLILPAVMPTVNALEVPGTVEIEALTCGLELDPASATSLNYGTLLENEESVEQSITVDPTGNTDVEMTISGGEWVDSTPEVQMRVFVTHWSTTPGFSYASGIALTSVPASVGTIFYPFAASFGLSFKIKPVLENPPFSGTLTQAVTLAAEC
jgi:hypothetical protein